MKRWQPYAVWSVIGVNVAAAVVTIVHAFTSYEPDWWATVSLVGMLAGIGGYVAGRTRPKKRASAVVHRRVSAWRKGDPVWRVAVPFVAVHPVLFTQRYVREVWKTRRRREVS